MSASAVVIHYEEALYQVYAPYCRRLALISPQWIRRFQPDRVFERSITLYQTCMYVQN